MKTEYKAIGGSAIGLAIIALLIATNVDLSSTTYYCENENSLRDCSYGISGGKGTRCYLNEEHDSWDYCSSGWIKADEFVNEQDTPPDGKYFSQTVIINNKGEILGGK